MKKIALSGKRGKGKYTLVDDEDFERVKDYSWSLLRGGYVRSNIGSRTIYLHRVIMLVREDEMVDHKNHNKLDNRKQNLRICTQSQNLANKRVKNLTKNTSGYKGVNWHFASKKWMARVQQNKKQIYLGLFNDIKKAALAYNKKAMELYGEFAYLNKI